MSDSPNTLRIDRWLHCCRFFKTRNKATEAVTGGHIKINGERATPGQRVKVGDRIELVRERLQYTLDVLKIPNRRGPAPEAQACYVENEKSIRQREALVSGLQQDRLTMPRTEGRPDKHTRRALIKRRGRA